MTGQSLPLVVCVVLNYRCAEETLACVERLSTSAYGNFRIVVVDNKSPDDSVVVLGAQLRGATLIPHDRNLGYGDGNNRGIREALALGADFVWVVSPDVRVEPGALAVLVRCMSETPRLGICGPVIQAGALTIKASRVNRAWGYYPTHVIARGDDRLDAVMPTDYVDGCAILLRRTLIEDVGLYREDFFLYFDETEYCLRAAEAGWLVRICGHAHVTTRPITDDRNDREFYMVRNSIALARTRHRFVGRAVLRNLVMPLTEIIRLRIRQFPRRVLENWRGIFAGLTMPLGAPPLVTVTQASAASRGKVE